MKFPIDTNTIISIILGLIVIILILIVIILILMTKNKAKKNNSMEETNSFGNHMIIDIPKKENFGEDAPPLYMVSEHKQNYIVGVLDGMGGSGSTLYEENGETHTGAYLASRVAKETIELFFKDKFSCKIFELTNNDITVLEDKIIEKLKDKLAQQHYEPSKIRSSLIRTLPTTLSLGYITQCNKNLKIKLIWAGDSRIYLLSAKKGLVQLTKDDLKLDNDPFQNIENDSPLSNMINLDEKFHLNYAEIDEISPIIIFAATDGCFGYYPTPIHFENLLLQTMQDSNTIDEWKQKISDSFQNVSGDDCSMSLVCFPNEKFCQLKELFRSRKETIYRDYMKEISEIEQNIFDTKKKEKEIKDEIIRYEKKKKEIYEKLWSKYKTTNYSFKH